MNMMAKSVDGDDWHREQELACNVSHGLILCIHLQLMLLSTVHVRSQEGHRRYVAYRNILGE
jgi:hypothetical protein